MLHIHSVVDAGGATLENARSIMFICIEYVDHRTTMSGCRVYVQAYQSSNRLACRPAMNPESGTVACNDFPKCFGRLQAPPSLVLRRVINISCDCDPVREIL